MILLDADNAVKEIENYYRQFPRQARRASVLAVNEAARFGRALSVREMRKQVRLPAKYVRDRLRITERARADRVQAAITGRHRPTSLARYIVGVPRRGKPVKVRVKPGGRTSKIHNGFLVELRSGDEGETNNIGLAVRLRKGSAPIRGKGVTLREDKYGKTVLLYSSSVDQVFRGVSGDVSPAIGDRLDSEFVRQFARLTA